MFLTITPEGEKNQNSFKLSNFDSNSYVSTTVLCTKSFSFRCFRFFVLTLSRSVKEAYLLQVYYNLMANYTGVNITLVTEEKKLVIDS